MGSWFSSPSPFIKNPSVYATKVDDKAVSSNVQTYDYVIVGGGKLKSLSSIFRDGLAWRQLSRLATRCLSSNSAHSFCYPGPAACVLANRLTEDPKISVLMVEAGKR